MKRFLFEQFLFKGRNYTKNGENWQSSSFRQYCSWLSRFNLFSWRSKANVIAKYGPFIPSNCKRPEVILSIWLQTGNCPFKRTGKREVGEMVWLTCYTNDHFIHIRIGILREEKFYHSSRCCLCHSVGSDTTLVIPPSGSCSNTLGIVV